MQLLLLSTKLEHHLPFIIADNITLRCDLILMHILSAVSCESLPSSWKGIMSETQFPMPPGSEVSLKCSPGHSLTGDAIVKCEEGTTFSFTVSPSCVLGLRIIKSITLVVDITKGIHQKLHGFSNHPTSLNWFSAVIREDYPSHSQYRSAVLFLKNCSIWHSSWRRSLRGFRI